MEQRIIHGFPPPQIDFYKVYVRSITYNQASYIEDCLNGVAAQKTSFPFVHHVIDDFSTDGEQNVIKDWMNKECEMKDAEYYDNDICTITLAKYKNNPNNIIVVYFLKKNLYKEKNKKAELFAPWRAACTYEAICEGDDYWTDPNKLQKQVDWMESHNDYSMCFHQAVEHSENGGFLDRPFAIIENRDYNGIELYRKWLVATASVVYRTKLHNTQIYQETRKNKNFCYGDITLFLSCAHEGKVRGMSDTMSVYRRNDGGITYSEFNTYKKSLRTAVHNHEIYKVFGEEYKADSDRIVLTILCSNYVKPGVPVEARREMIDYAKSISIYKTYILICKYFILTRLRGVKQRLIK